jgi:hypothetical protein
MERQIAESEDRTTPMTLAAERSGASSEQMGEGEHDQDAADVESPERDTEVSCDAIFA